MLKNKADFDKAVSKRRKIKSLIKKLEAKLDVVDADIIKYAKAKGTEGGKDNNTMIVIGDGYKVSVIEITQHPWDNDKLKAFLGDMVPEYQRTNTYDRIDIR